MEISELVTVVSIVGLVLLLLLIPTIIFLILLRSKIKENPERYANYASDMVIAMMGGLIVVFAQKLEGKNLLSVEGIILFFGAIMLTTFAFYIGTIAVFHILDYKKEKNTQPVGKKTNNEKLNSIINWLKKTIGQESEEDRVFRIEDDIAESYPELASADDNDLKKIRAYYEVKSIERERMYKIILIALTFVTAWVGLQNLQLEKSNFIHIYSQNCPDEAYSYVLHTFTFVNVGRSSGSILVGYDNESTEISFRELGVEKEFNNPQSLVVKNGDSITYQILATPNELSNMFNFTVLARTNDWCNQRTCSYQRAENNFYKLEKVGTDSWVRCSA